MPFFRRETLDAIRNIPLYEIVSPVVNLSRSGSNWRGLSPFTNEKTPSFYVLTEKNFFKCFSSGLAGDGIKFVQETEKLGFPEAIEALAERFNVTLEYEDGVQPNSIKRSLKREILDIHEYATDYYHRAFLAEHEQSNATRDYWADRGFSLDTAKFNRIGMAPVEPRKLMPLLLKHGFSNEALAECGLFYTPRNSHIHPASWKHRFRGRLMIPICDYQGQVVAFTARQLPLTPEDDPAKEAKYINSPETPIFRKGEMLFNLHLARKAAQEKSRFLLVEGQLDAIRCHSMGLEEAVAPQGTAITEEQLSLLKRYLNRLDVLLDGDSAGLKAIYRLMPIALKVGLDVRVIPLPEGSDPDDFLSKNGSDGFHNLEESAQSGIPFVVKSLLKGSDGPNASGEKINQVFEMLLSCESEITQQAHLEEVIKAGNLPPEACQTDFRRFANRKRRRALRREAAPAEPLLNDGNKLTSSITDLLWIILQNAEWAYTVASVVDREWIGKIQTEESRLLARILDEIEAGNWEGISTVEDLFDDNSLKVLAANLYVEERTDVDINNLANASINSIAKSACRRAIEEMDQQIHTIYKDSSTSPQLSDLYNRKKELRQFLLKGEIGQIHLNTAT